MAGVVFCTQSSELPDGLDFRETFRALASAINTEAHLLPQHAVRLSMQFLHGLSCLGFVGTELIAHCTLWEICRQASVPWYELGSTWVRPDHRRQQVNHLMYQHFLPLHKGKNILATTTNVASRRVGRDIGLIEIPRQVLPEGVWRASCTCSSVKMGAAQVEGCKRASREAQQEGAECWFRITPEAAGRLAR